MHPGHQGHFTAPVICPSQVRTSCKTVNRAISSLIPLAPLLRYATALAPTDELARAEPRVCGPSPPSAATAMLTVAMVAVGIFCPDP